MTLIIIHLNQFALWLKWFLFLPIRLYKLQFMHLASTKYSFMGRDTRFSFYYLSSLKSKMDQWFHADTVWGLENWLLFSGFSNTGQREKILQTKSTSSSAQLAPFGDGFHPARGTSPVRGFFEEKDGHDTTQSTLVSSVKMSHSTETSSSKQYTVIHLEFSSYVGSCVIIIEGVDRDIGQVLVNVNVDILAKYQSNQSNGVLV